MWRQFRIAYGVAFGQNTVVALAMADDMQDWWHCVSSFFSGFVVDVSMLFSKPSGVVEDVIGWDVRGNYW